MLFRHSANDSCHANYDDREAKKTQTNWSFFFHLWFLYITYTSIIFDDFINMMIFDVLMYWLEIEINNNISNKIEKEKQSSLFLSLMKISQFFFLILIIRKSAYDIILTWQIAQICGDLSLTFENNYLYEILQMLYYWSFSFTNK